MMLLLYCLLSQYNTSYVDVSLVCVAGIFFRAIVSELLLSVSSPDIQEKGY